MKAFDPDLARKAQIAYDNKAGLTFKGGLGIRV